MKKIKSVGVIGAGTMGSALTQKFAQEGFNVILADKEQKFIDKGINNIKSTLNEGIERKIFTSDTVEEIINRIKPSCNLNDLKSCDLVIEAIFEDFNVKSDLFKTLNSILPVDTIIATNTSSFSVDELSKSVNHPERFIGLHYFYHAAKNRLVEIIPGESTSKETFESIKQFCVQSGKEAIVCKDSYGFVVNRFFVPWLNESVRIIEEGTATPGEIDAVCMKVFSIGMGPFALMNATGVPIAYHAQKTLERFGELYKTSDALRQQAEKNELWKIDSADLEKIPKEKITSITNRMLGIVFLVCSQIMDENVCEAVDINRGARIGLRWRKGPIDLMTKYGSENVKDLLKYFVDKYKTEEPKSIGEKYWQMEFINLSKSNKISVITIIRPEDLNALNETVVRQLSEKFDIAEKDSETDTIIITGSGKAFVAGADIKFFIDNIKSKTLDNIVNFTKYGQQVYQKIDDSSKKVIALINGLALGGGLELALCADIIAVTSKSMIAFPETGIGIYPGLGGTQRTQKKIGKGLAKYLIYTGDFLNASQSKKIGLADYILSQDEAQDLLIGTLVLEKKSHEKTEDEYYSPISNFFYEHSISEILSRTIDQKNLSQETIEKLKKKISQKAPISLKFSEQLIDEARGVQSELEYLKQIFSTEDALLGLSSIGKRIEFKGK